MGLLGHNQTNKGRAKQKLWGRLTLCEQPCEASIGAFLSTAIKDISPNIGSIAGGTRVSELVWLLAS